MEKKKNNYIELCRFIFCIVIFLHHSGFVSATGLSAVFNYGSLGADFFYIVTGFFAMAHVSKIAKDSIPQKMEYSMRYTINKLIKVFPYAAIGSISIYGLEFVWSNAQLSLSDRILNLQNIPFELFMTPMSGTIPVNLLSYRNAPMWFLSAMTMALPVLMFLALKYEDVFKHWMTIFLPPLIFCLLIHNTEGVVNWDYYMGFFYAGVLRAFADMMLGFLAFYVSAMVREKLNINIQAVKIIITTGEVLLLLSVLYTCNRNLNGYDQVLTIYAFVLMIILCTSNISYTGNLPGNKIFGFLGKMSMPMYCLHWAVYKYVALIAVDFSYWEKVAIAFINTFVAAFVFVFIIDKVREKNKLVKE